MSKPLWHVIEDPAFIITVYAGIVIIMMLIGAIAIYVITQSIFDSALASLPPIFIALIMVAAKMAIKRNEVALYPDKIVIIRGNEKRELPIYAITRVRVRPVINTVRIRGVRFIPTFNVPRLSTWSVTFMSGNEELVKVWINENELDRLRSVINKICRERLLCINIENALLS
ncbi:MAG: hypothetical protein RXN89_03335 [Vulcanisaeta sp.]|jgi:hypothetical protein|uniref:hypothetical protein n=1 Tax=Vulcanisaeta sp. EB80 TaxID=1650660 RepID=UPI000746E92D|nr:hypothetical protein [Vulcanisaeta sp. EB80]KUO83004.1 MAG: hypothetical protein AT714_00590 [Vulcanisaeta sp. OSP_8]MCG2865024.1 hypothetical protein [Vulcanisaeta sp.]MCG2866706.1 hypothetical protein [Vulcanisaeta sp.]MCG2885636.1 hypothetical protein [Vulcanisaeta sp.]MDT7864042.1 hypothetical protein [Vulcanisaeta sp.]